MVGVAHTRLIKIEGSSPISINQNAERISQNASLLTPNSSLNLVLLFHDLVVVGKAEVRTARITAAHEARQIILIQIDLALIVVKRLIVVIVCAEFTA